MQFDVGAELAERYGLDAAGCAGEPFGTQPWHRATYYVGAPGPGRPTTIASVRIRGWHNLGNQVHQLLHALAFAEQNGIDTISGPATPWFRSGTVAGVRLSFGGRFARPALVGHYFYPQPLGVAEPWRRTHHLRGLRELFAVEPDPTVPADEMVVHLRSGDVFGADPHPGYFPPHLGYYTSAVAHAVERGAVTSVRLVCQDHVHPVLEPLRGWCLARGLGATVQVSDDLHADVATLVAGRTLGISQGTLGLSAGWLSPVLRTVYLPPGAHVRDLLDLGSGCSRPTCPGRGSPGGRPPTRSPHWPGRPGRCRCASCPRPRHTRVRRASPRR
jgi:hypothetical protein